MDGHTKTRPLPLTPGPTSRPTPEPDYESAVSWQSALAFFLAAALGAALALWLLPHILPIFFSDIAAQKAYWHLARASGVIAYLLLWLSAALGLLITNRMARVWPGGPTAFDLHQFTSLLSLAFTGFHALILLGDDYISYSLAQILIPFAAAGYRPIATGLGQVAFYLAIMVTFSFYVKKRIGRRAWRIIHYASFLLFILIILHGLTAGTDASSLRYLYLVSFGSILFLTLYRILITHATKTTSLERRDS